MSLVLFAILMYNHLALDIEKTNDIFKNKRG